MTTHRLRANQTNVISEVEAAWASGVQNVVVISPTGSGKTTIFSALIERARTPAISIAHRAELVSQMSVALAREGVRHRVIGPDTLRRSCVQAHMEELGRSFYDPTSPYAVAGVDTLVRMDRNDPLFASIGLWVCDECFPAGTSISTPGVNIPIERLRVGDYVTAFNEATGSFEPRRVTRLFRNPMSVLMTQITVGRRVTTCTVTHPFLTERGWVDAHMLEPGDLLIDSDGDRQPIQGVRTGTGHPGEFVYNIEVEGLHTYVANGFVVHNCHHHLRDNKWGKCTEMMPNARGLGVTAEEKRADGKGIGRSADGVFDHMIVNLGLRGQIEEGYLTDYRPYVPKSDLDLANVHISASGDFNPEELRAARRRSTLTGDVVKHYVKLAMGKLGVTFDTDIVSAGETCAAFRAAGVPAEVLSGKTPAAQRSQILRRFKNRQIWQIVSVDVISEGFDLPAIEVVSFARATMSFGLFIQQAGRALRLMIDPKLMAIWESFTPDERRANIAASGKPYAIIIDHVGNFVRHGPPDRMRARSLESRERRSRTTPDDAIPIRVCENPECNAPYERVLLQCPYCGEVPTVTERSKPEFVDGDLALLDPATLAVMRGEVARIDGAPVMPYGADRMIQASVHKRHAERQEHQTILRHLMAMWGGWQTMKGRELAEAQRRFFHRFKVDVLSAQALGATDAIVLAERVADDLIANDVDVAVNKE